MAITYRGTVKTAVQYGNDALLQNLFTIENGYQSRVNVYVRKLSLEIDSIAALAAMTPLAKVSRAIAISGGQIIEKCTFDTALTSDVNVIMRAGQLEAARITATPGNVIWEQFTNRMHTAVEQQKFPNKYLLLPSIVGDVGKEFKLRPGEAVLVQVVTASGAWNAALTNNYIVECAFEEDPIATFTIGGTVTLSGTGQADARVMVIEADDVLMTNAFLREVIVTPAGGAWSSTIRTGKVGAAFVQYKNGATYYTAPGSPFLSA